MVALLALCGVPPRFRIANLPAHIPAALVELRRLPEPPASWAREPAGRAPSCEVRSASCRTEPRSQSAASWARAASCAARRSSPCRRLIVWARPRRPDRRRGSPPALGGGGGGALPPGGGIGVAPGD